MVKRAEILELIQEEIAEREQAIMARPSSKREFEISLVSSGMNIVEAQDNEQAKAFAQHWRL